MGKYSVRRGARCIKSKYIIQSALFALTAKRDKTRIRLLIKQAPDTRDRAAMEPPAMESFRAFCFPLLVVCNRLAIVNNIVHRRATYMYDYYNHNDRYQL